ncbi:MAG: hypothetical protein IJX05_04455 [Clostridia bacterium]|nr:hypothetical protein [Clostridia bacterium]
MAKVTIKKKRRRWIKPVIISMIIIGLLVFYYFIRIVPVMRTMIVERVRMQVSEAIDNMTELELKEIEYDDLIITRYNSDGYLSVLQVNSVNVDMFSRRVTSLVRQEMAKFEEEGIPVALGTLTGLPFLSGIGPEFQFQLLNLGVVDAEFYSEFLSSGINQTLHKLYMRVVVNMTIVLPGYTMDLDNSSQVIICESVVSGEVPFGDVAIGGGSDLLP